MRVVGVIRHIHAGGWGGGLTFNHLPGTRRDGYQRERETERGDTRTRKKGVFNSISQKSVCGKSI